MDELALFDVDLRPLADLAAAGARTAGLPTAPAPPPGPRGPRPPRVLVVDGNSLAHRAFHAYVDVTDSHGRPRGAVLGFLSLLTGICDRVDPDAVVVGFDCRQRSARRQSYPGYKAQRPDKDPALTMQLDDLVFLLGRLEVGVVVPEGYEADDVLGSAAHEARLAGWECVLATSDRDSFALVDAGTTVLRLRSGLDAAVEVTPASLQRSLGVRPDQYTEYAALRGDTSDNLPGVVGVGPKRAAALLREYPCVAAAVADPFGCRSVLGREAGQALINDLARPASSVFLRNMDLMRIRTDVPVDLDGARPSLGADDVERILLAWELPTLVRRVTVALGVRPELPPPPGDEDAPR